MPRSQGDGPWAFLRKSGGPLIYCGEAGESRKEEASLKVCGDVCLLGYLHSNSFLSLRMPRQGLNMLFGSCSRPRMSSGRSSLLLDFGNSHIDRPFICMFKGIGLPR